MNKTKKMMNIYEKANACCIDIQWVESWIKLRVESWELRVMITFYAYTIKE